MGGNSDHGSHPVSMRQRRILDVAERNPNASVDELASMVTTASPELVERVLDEHGDPAADDGDSTAAPSAGGDEPVTAAGEAMADGNGESPDDDATDGTDGSTDDDATDGYPAVDELADKHRRALAAVAARPEATQSEIAERLDVTRATVSRWTNSIEGFDWSDRESFVDAVFDGPPSVDVTTDGGSTTESEGLVADGTDTAPSTDDDPDLDRLEERVSALEAARDGVADSGTEAGSAFEDPDLVHKVVHACLNAETISEDEELRILKELMA
jgi:transcriptional regulator with XRE-family HTH domain